ncbi:8095_t:CDS:2, partial [Dentiscutata erythropus]
LLKRSSRNSNKTEIIYTSPQRKSEEEETQTPATITGDTSDSESDNGVETANEEHVESDERINNETVLNKSDINLLVMNNEEQLLRAIVVESDDHSLALSLDMECTSQSLVVNATVKSVTITLTPTQKHVRISVLHNNQRRVKPYMSAESNSVPVATHTYVVSLRDGLNLIDVWVSPPKDNDYRKEKRPTRKSRRLANEEETNNGRDSELRAVDKGKMKEYVEREEGTDNEVMNSEMIQSDEDFNMNYGQKYTLFVTRLEMNVAR